MKKLTSPLLLIGGGADDADVRYATGFAAVDPVFYVQLSEETKALLVPAMEKGRAEKASLGKVCVISPEDLHLRARKGKMFRALCALLRAYHVRRIAVSSRCPIGVVDGLQQQGIKVRVQRGAIFPQRAIKSAEEIKCISRVQGAAAAAFTEAIGFLRKTAIDGDGLLRANGKRVRAEDVRRIIEVKLLESGCRAEGTIVACGPQAADPHEQGSGLLAAHQPIVIDIFPRDSETGYWGDLTRTVVRGKASDEVRRMYRAVLRAQRLALRALKPGITGARIHRMVHQELKRHGFETTLSGKTTEGFVHGTGHGVGLEIHEAPSLSVGGGPLHENMVVTVEPGLYYRQWGGVRIEDTVVVTEHGGRILVRVPYTLEI